MRANVQVSNEKVEGGFASEQNNAYNQKTSVQEESLIISSQLHLIHHTISNQ